jgi:hypothetical protein
MLQNKRISTPPLKIDPACSRLSVPEPLVQIKVEYNTEFGSWLIV